MINTRAFQNYLADCVAKHLAPELQPAARQAIADKQLTPLVLEAVAKQIEESAVAAAKSCSADNTKLTGDLTSSVRSLEQHLAEKNSGEKIPDKVHAAIAEIGTDVDDVRNSLRTLEDKVDTLVPYQVWKVAVFAGLAFVIGAVASWNIRPVYKQWQWEQEQKEGR